MQYYLPAVEIPAAGTQRILQQLLDSIAMLLAAATPLTESGIHELRKTCKKLRGLLRMIRPGLAPDKFDNADRAVRELASQLSGQRDSKVLIDTLDKIEQHFSGLLDATALAPLREALQQRLVLTSAASATSADCHALQQRLQQISSAFAEIDFEEIDQKAIISGMVDCYRHGRRACAALDTEPDTDNAHALRKQAKYLFYQLRFIAAWNDEVLTPMAEKFHQLEDILGNDHDLAMLVTTLASQPQLCPGRTRRELLNALAESRRIVLLSDALRLAGALYRDKPRKYRKWLKAAC